MSSRTEGPVLAVVKDLFFVARIRETAAPSALSRCSTTQSPIVLAMRALIAPPVNTSITMPATITTNAPVGPPI